MNKTEALEKLVKKTDKKFQKLLEEHPHWNAQYMAAFHNLMDWHDKEEKKIIQEYCEHNYDHLYKAYEKNKNDPTMAGRSTIAFCIHCRLKKSISFPDSL